jgi:ATP-dependent RNA helicase RhlB
LYTRALIIAPTRELVIQITKDGRQLSKYTDIRIASVYGGTDYKKQMDFLEKKRCDIIVATPGRLLDFCRKNVVKLEKCQTLVIDEADRMLDMGFIPDVRRIVSQLPDKQQRQTLLFSATITDEVKRLAYQWCNKPVNVAIEPEQVAVESVDQKVYLVTSAEKYTVLYNLIQKNQGSRMAVFTNQKVEAKKLHDRLRRNGINCTLLSGDIPQDKRTRRLESFRSGQVPILVATDVAGRGIHIEGITHVVNYTLPYEPEDYVHRIGRTGRAGALGVSVSFACEEESFVLPEIEEYIGRKLDCFIPEEEYLTLPPKGTVEKTAQRKVGTSGRRRPPGANRKQGVRSS